VLTAGRELIDMQTEVIMTGIGGQGVQLCAKVLALAATNEGRQAMLSAHYGGEMRGGQTEASVVVGDAPLRSLPILPSTWSAFVMHPHYWPPVRERLRPGGVVVANSSVTGDDFGELDALVFPVPADDLAAGVNAPMGAGFVLLGAYCSLTGMVGLPSLIEAMTELVPPYRTQHIAANRASLEAGAGAAPSLAAPAWSASPGPVAGAR
jgi:2-oxoglutarate ferredoxin oxidoreductase subunit gamma